MKTDSRRACPRNGNFAHRPGHLASHHLQTGLQPWLPCVRQRFTRPWLSRPSVNTDAARVAVSHCETVTTPGSCSSVALAGRPSEAWLCPFPPAGGAVSPQSRPRPRSCHAGDAPSTPACPPCACSLAGRRRCVAAKSGRHLYFSDTLSAVRGKTIRGVQFQTERYLDFW